MNTWRFIRLMAGVIFVFSKYWLPSVSFNEQFFLPFLFMGCYLLFIEAFTFLVYWKKINSISKFFSRCRFWKFEIVSEAEIEFPHAKISVRTTFIQVLIAVSGFLLAFISTKTYVLEYPKFIIASILISIISGLLYSFIFGGGITEEITGEKHLIKISRFHESWMEICLNIQVVSLIFGISLLMFERSFPKITC